MESQFVVVLQIVVAILQIAALFIAYRLAVKQFRMSKGSSYLERFLQKELVEARESVDHWLDDTPEGCLAKLKADRHTKTQLTIFANFFQELSIAYRRGLADRRYVEDVFAFLVQSYWQKLRFWIEADRKEKQRPTLYEDWEALDHAVRKSDQLKSRSTRA